MSHLFNYKLIESDITIDINEIIDEDLKKCATIMRPSFHASENIEVEKEGDKYEIVDGMHRLAACLRNGEKTIVVDIYKSI